MPYRVSIPDVCDRYGCSISETAQIIAKILGVDLMNPLLKLPTPMNKRVTYSDKETGEILAEIVYYTIEIKASEE